VTTTDILDGINAQARAFKQAEAQYEKAFRLFSIDVPPLSPEHFWPMADAFRLIVLRTMQYGHERVADVAADEFFRQAVTGQSPYDLSATVHFALSYRKFSVKAYAGGDECGFGFGRGDDGYCDLMDSVVLLGREFNERLHVGRFYDLSYFNKAVDGCCHASVQATDFPFEYTDDPVGNRASLASRLRKLILYGENYFAMFLEDAAQVRVASEAMQKTRGEE
jgi:hypothetical protein